MMQTFYHYGDSALLNPAKIFQINLLLNFLLTFNVLVSSFSFKMDLSYLPIAALVVYVELKKRQKRKKCWSRNWLLRRKRLGCYENLLRELAMEDQESYRRFLRMDTDCFEYLLGKVEPLINKRNTPMREAIPAGERLAVTLRYLATGETQSSLGFNFRIAQNTISGIIPEVCKAIIEVLKNEIKVPRSSEEWIKISEDFLELWNFPNCIGALDGKHICISPPPNSGSLYWNYKHFNSIILLALVDANLKFIYVDIGTNGRISDGGVFKKSTLKKNIEQGNLRIPGAQILPGTQLSAPFVIVADEAFPLEKYILKPYPGKSLELPNRIFNYRLSRARRVSENAFGILANRFRVFQSKILTRPVNAKLIVMAACSLHNFLRSRCLELYSPIPSLDREDIGQKKIIKGNWRDETNPLIPLANDGKRGTFIAKAIRNEFMSYVNGIGSVSWQTDMCDFH